ncbi:MAG: methylenetetrahydrofolate reductase C-terminal domain-containing protein, partial [Verrucomicrobia bacterium]|nr:methylenetetrahydrofolate reductase C-terminal domain-containing protein [Verrucomicrobiota bacterium]
KPRNTQLVIHLTCKDLNRNGLESAAWRYAAEGFDNILALTGDYPVAGYQGQAMPVFDLDSVSLISMLRSMNGGLEVVRPSGKSERLPKTNFFIGCAVSPFKRQERELMPQYFKLARKIQCGAQWVIPQLGYDMRKFHEVKLFLDWANLSTPIIGNVYVLNRTVAGLFNKNKIPGCVVSDALGALAEKYAAGPDKGRAFFTELAAKQLAVFKGMGFAAGYLGGIHKAETFAQIIDMAESFGPDDWKAFAKEIQFSKPQEFYLFEQDPRTGLGNSAQLNRNYLQSLQQPPKTASVTLNYQFTRLVHALAFTPGRKLFPTLQKIYGRLEQGGSRRTLKALHGIEHASKALIYGCKDCGDCSLPDTGYLCPRASCSKTARNGPCGGSADGRCELNDKDCLWARAYDRLKYYGESKHMLEGPAVFANAALGGTSGWANNFLGRDHHHAAVPAATKAPANATPREKKS